ncbi:MAG: TIGR04053 family radical SAM/SPASM domain-containing protein [Deltaproteobacteria bacterium]|nr:TIGR04053 family radical SAM/SPASM domain-containing protein [Deltaproteobacteria bacterium]
MKTASAMDSGVGVGGNHGPDRMVYSDAPFLTYWEITRACDLACRHCRADAITQRDPRELTTSESKELLKKIRGFGECAPHLVLTGGDPLKRPDFFDFLEYGASLGLRMSVAPSGTIALTRDVLKRFKATGVESISLSLDGSTAERHDSFRGVSGCFARTFEAAHLACEEGLGLQVNTLATEQTEAELPEIYRLVSQLDLMRWSVFFLIGVGRGQALKELTPERCEALHHWLYDLSREASFAVATTEAPHFRRVAYTRMRAEGIPSARIRQTPVGRGFGIRDGNGIMFIGHTGEICPAGFLPLVAGNVRSAHIVDIYRESELFRKIRETSGFKGRCGICEFKDICGGSRARAYATYGDCLAEDPACSYQPAQYDRHHGAQPKDKALLSH